MEIAIDGKDQDFVHHLAVLRQRQEQVGVADVTIDHLIIIFFMCVSALAFSTSKLSLACCNLAILSRKFEKSASKPCALAIFSTLEKRVRVSFLSDCT